MTENLPTFVVVGNVNQGKSSIVASLVEDEAVPIDSYPGTTATTASYSFRVGGQEVFRIIDTPGFQDARAALAWMHDRAESAADRPAAVRAFVDEHRNDEAFVDEIRLLTPILEGAGILYVVDASSRYQPSNEAEMEILRWTGQPGMSLLNRTRERDFGDEWRPVLEQFFNIVREFNAHDAGFADRMDLLRGFRELRPEWRTTIERAILAMEREWDERRERSAAVIGDFLVRALGHLERRSIDAHRLPPELEEELTREYEKAQRKHEKQARDELERIYNHPQLDRESDDLALLTTDLFSEESWRLFGLDRTQLAKYGAAWGAVVGGGIDLLVGGLSFFLGAAAGAGIGAVTGYFGGTQVAKTWSGQSGPAMALFKGETGRFFFKGPVSNPRYAWLLVDRALVHFQTVRARSHARRDALKLPASESDAKQGIAAKLPGALRDRVDKALREVLQQLFKGVAADSLRGKLTAVVDEVLRALPET